MRVLLSLPSEAWAKEGGKASIGMRVLLSGKAPAFQAGHTGSIPVARSNPTTYIPPPGVAIPVLLIPAILFCRLPPLERNYPDLRCAMSLSMWSAIWLQSVNHALFPATD